MNFSGRLIPEETRYVGWSSKLILILNQLFSAFNAYFLGTLQIYVKERRNVKIVGIRIMMKKWYVRRKVTTAGVCKSCRIRVNSILKQMRTHRHWEKNRNKRDGFRAEDKDFPQLPTWINRQVLRPTKLSYSSTLYNQKKKNW